MSDGPFEQNRLSVLTFNYDRSLEAFFFCALRNLYGLNAPDAEARLRKIPIIHLYGSLGEEQFWQNLRRGAQPYQPDLRSGWVSDAAESIKIMHEVKRGPEFDQAENLLCDADEIIFLGFGFHRVNLERLNLSAVISQKERSRPTPGEWLACRTGMGEGDIRRPQRYVPVQVTFAPDRNWKIADFLSNMNCLIP